MINNPIFNKYMDHNLRLHKTAAVLVAAGSCPSYKIEAVPLCSMGREEEAEPLCVISVRREIYFPIFLLVRSNVYLLYQCYVLPVTIF